MTKWSKFQQAVFDFIQNGVGHLMIDAVAGSGKTTTIVEALRFVMNLSCLFVAFNKSIATELQKRAPAGVTVSTLHSLGLRACSQSLNRPRVDGDKVKGLLPSVKGLSLFCREREWCLSLVKAVSLAKSYLASDAEAIGEVIDLHGLVPPETAKEREVFIADVLLVLNACKANVKTLDFDDMIWLPIALNLSVPQYDRVFVDETQDLNAAQIQLVLKAVTPAGRICAVGDPRQAIYGFRGAASDAFGNVRDALGATTLPLSVSYRCPRSVIREAQKYVPHIEAAEGAEEGIVEACSHEAMLAGVKEGDFILSRTNAPLMSLCLSLLKDGRKARIQGRDVGTKLASTIKRAKTAIVDAMLDYVDRWAATETARLERADKDPQSIIDIAECIHALSEGETAVDAVLAKIDRLFSDAGDGIVLSTTHKAKGMERDTVWLLRSTYLRTRKGKSAPSEEEVNLYYVGVTRARKALYLVAEKRA